MNEMASLQLNMYQTLGLAVVALLLGAFLKKKIRLLERFCIPSPVIGGLIFSIVTCVLYVTGVAEISFNDTLREVCMVFFFTSVGFQADIKVLRSGGKALLLLLVLTAGLAFSQNGLAVGFSRVLGLKPLVGMCTGSIPMLGGHGTSAAFGPVLERLGVSGGTTFCTAAATYGLVAGSLLGGPIANRLIRKKNLTRSFDSPDDPVLVQKKESDSLRHYAPAAFYLALAVGAGSLFTWLLSKTGLAFPSYIGAMIAAVLIRNIGELTGKARPPMAEIDSIGGIMLSLFLGMALISLKLWQLAEIALPLMILLAVQTVFMIFYARFVVFHVMGGNYDAAFFCAGVCGFGMGATPNAMANIQAVAQKYVLSVKAFLLIPIVGGVFVDFINSTVITLFVNVL